MIDSVLYFFSHLPIAMQSIVAFFEAYASGVVAFTSIIVFLLLLKFIFSWRS